jgi:primosomal protein N' (replication factor Y)
MDPRSGGADALYTYLASGSAMIGDAVFVPLANRPTLGYVTDIYDATEEDLGFPVASLRPISSVVEGLSLPLALIELARFLAVETLCSLPVALSAATPPGVRDRLATVWTLARELSPEEKVPPSQREIIRTLLDSGGSVTETKGKKLDDGVLRGLRALRKLGVVRQVLKVQTVQERRDQDPMIRLTADNQRVEQFLKQEGKRKPAQALTLMRLQGAERALLTAPELQALAGVTGTTIRALTEAGLLEKVGADEPTVGKSHTPNPAQQVAIDAITESVLGRESQSFLLYGITGSGKTEVYLRAAAEALRTGRQVLYLVPEIALAAQAIAQLRDRFGRSVAVIHSELSAPERLRNWMHIRDGQSSVVVGARSALFAPLTDIGLIVVDEEHEASYKQESAPRYHVKNVARFLAAKHSCPLVLGSATPSIESFWEAEMGEGSKTKTDRSVTLLSLPMRAASARLPEVFVRDLSEGYRRGSPTILCPDLHDAVIETIGRGEQVILFLNRRAYAPFIICRDCGHQMMCPHCAVSLSWHRRDGRLRCHHCGFQILAPETCPNCEGNRLNPFGVGTEKVEEAVAAEFPDAKVARLDRDVARRKGALEETLAAFRSGDIQILVGTQMIAKGLDFPNVTLVGVIAADVSLNIPDFRSSERTFQLLAQVGGRAGRGQSPGRVFIQTFNPLHPSLVTAQSHDFIGMYESLKLERAEAGYPPFKRLVNVLLTSEDRNAVLKASEEAGRRVLASLSSDSQLLGPVDCAVERVQGRWRRHLLIKLSSSASPAAIGEALLAFAPKDVQVTIDVDPYTLM